MVSFGASSKHSSLIVAVAKSRCSVDTNTWRPRPRLILSIARRLPLKESHWSASLVPCEAATLATSALRQELPARPPPGSPLHHRTPCKHESIALHFRQRAKLAYSNPLWTCAHGSHHRRSPNVVVRHESAQLHKCRMPTREVTGTRRCTCTPGALI